MIPGGQGLTLLWDDAGFAALESEDGTFVLVLNLNRGLFDQDGISPDPEVL